MLLIAIVNAALLVPAAVLPASRFDTAGGLFSIGALAVVLITYGRGLRAGLLTSVFLGAASAATIVASTSTVVGVAMMTLVSLGQGLAARRGLQGITSLVPITLGFVIAEPPTRGPLDTPASFGLTLTAFTVAVSLVVGLIARGAPRSTTQQGMSNSRASAYAALLAITTAATTTIALSGDWGHAGGWLIMTPFIVIQPYVQDGWRKALARAAGTMAGFAIAAGLAQLIDSPLVLTIAGFGFATIAIVAIVRKWHYAIYATFLTPAIVILESGGRAVTQLADKRLEATLLAVALSMLAMAAAIPIYRKEARKLGLAKY